MQKKEMIAYLKLKLEQEDWHGVMDAAADIREIVAKMQIMEALANGENIVPT
jgi:hypothetical protein